MKPLRIYKASAGSGKTFTLAVEYIALLAINPLEYQNILAVTFTNKATAEMKQRILSTLYAIANNLPSGESYVESILANLKERQHTPPYTEEPYRTLLAGMNREMLQARAKEALENIIHDYSRFHIETIDSFFQGIVREIANELELSVKMKVELDDSEVLSDAVDHIITNLKEGSSEFRTIIEFIEEKIRENRSWQVEDTVKEFGRNIFKENYLIHGEDVRKKITDSKVIFQYRTLISSLATQKKDAVIAQGKALRDQIADSGITDKDITKTILTFLDKVCDYKITEPTNQGRGTFSDSVKEYTENVDKWFKKTSKSRDTFEPVVNNQLMPMLRQLFNLHDDYVAHLHNVTAIGQHLYSLMLLNQISSTVKTLNENSSRFLLSETANFLRNIINNQDIPFIYEKTGTVIKHIMIDEFQDTSVLQWGNFKPLILNSLSTDGSCLIVGDVKQSIYRFRNSDWQILNNIEQDTELRSHMETIPAQYNYRSSKRVVEFNNELFTRAVSILQGQCPALLTAYNDVVQIAKKDSDAGYVRVENIDYHAIDPDNMPEEWDKDISELYEEATLQRIQAAVKTLLEQGVQPNDITVLVRTNREVPLISDYFEDHQEELAVKVVSDEAFRIGASTAVNIIISALRVLADPTSKLHMATLEHHAQTIPDSFSKQACDEMRYKPLTEQVEDISQIFHLEEMPGQDAYLLFFADVVAQYAEDHPADLSTFLQMWDEKLCDKTIPNGASDGLHIMTMHKSKGLEFHTVIIPSCSWPIKPKDKEVMWCIPSQAPYNQVPLLPISVSKAKDDSIFAADRREEELRTLVDNINVLYVAFTRAKHNLIILTGNKAEAPMHTPAPEETPQIDSAQSFLINAMPPSMQQQDLEGIITLYQSGAIVPSVSKKEEREDNPMQGHYTPLPVSYISRPSTAEFRQSYESDLFLTEDTPGMQQHAQRIRLISLGNLYHSIFEHIHTLEDVPRAIQLLESKGCFTTLLDAQEAEATVTRLIKTITPEHPQWFSPNWQVLNERAILFLEHQSPATRRPDRVVVNGQQAIIIDYKTARDVLRKAPDGTYTAPAKNLQQVEEYKQLLTQIGYTDIKAYLWYILDEIVVEA